MAVITCVVCAVAGIAPPVRKDQWRSVLAILFYRGIASGVMMAGISGQGSAGLSAYLFGSLTSVTATDLWVIGILGAVILVLSIGLAPRLFAVAVDEDYARVLGIKVQLLNLSSWCWRP